MKRKAKWKKAAQEFTAILLTAVLLTGCGDKKTDSNHSDHIVSNFTNLCNNGELYTDSADRLNFCDFETMQSAVLCPNPNCTHSGSDTCSAFGMNNHPVIYNGSLYFFESEIVQEDNVFKYHSKIYKANTDGTNRSVVNEIDDLNIPEYVRMMVYNDIAYFPAEKVEFDEYGNTTGYTTNYLYSYDFSSEKLTNITEICRGYSGGSWIYGAYNGKIYLSYSSSEEQLDYTDLSAFENLETHYMSYNISENIYETSDLPVPTLVQDGYYFYVDGNSMVAVSEDKKETVISNFNYNEIALVDNKLFSAWNGVVADLGNGKVYQLKETEWETVDFVNNKYILEKTEDSGKSYKAVDSKELIGDEQK